MAIGSIGPVNGDRPHIYDRRDSGEGGSCLSNNIGPFLVVVIDRSFPFLFIDTCQTGILVLVYSHFFGFIIT